MDFIWSFLVQYRLLISLLVTLLVTVLVIKKFWDEISFWWLNTWYSFPLIGKEVRLAKDYESKSKVGKAEWLSAESTLCADFLSHYEKVDKDQELYGKSQDYLTKATENGRNNLHFLGWVLIVALVFVEAMGFSYVLSGFTIPGASEDLQQQGALGIAFIISVLLVGLTHFTGHEIHANSLIKKVRVWWKNDKTTTLTPDTSINLEKTYQDNNAPAYQKLFNRIPSNAQAQPRYVITTLTVIAIIVIAVLATYVRGQVLERMHIDEVSLGQASSSGPVDPFAIAAPAILVQEQSEALGKAGDDAWDRERKGGWGTFIFLACLFVFLQAFGILIGYKTGFAGKHSKDARSIIGNFKSEKEYKNFYSRARQQVARIAQQRLTNLQKRMVWHASNHANDHRVIEMLENHSGERTFLQYVENQNSQEQIHQIRSKNQSTVLNDSAEIASPVSEILDDRDVAEETMAQRELRIRAELVAEFKAEKAAPIVETDEQIKARLREAMLKEIV